jgi:hypothetical protein
MIFFLSGFSRTAEIVFPLARGTLRSSGIFCGHAGNTSSAHAKLLLSVGKLAMCAIASREKEDPTAHEGVARFEDEV